LTGNSQEWDGPEASAKRQIDRVWPACGSGLQVWVDRWTDLDRSTAKTGMCDKLAAIQPVGSVRFRKPFPAEKRRIRDAPPPCVVHNC
jgi:hypothetical protein